MLKYLCALLVLATPAFAQESAPNTEALSQRVIQGINSNLQCNTSLIALQREVVKLKAELDKLKEGDKPKQ